MIKLIIKHTPLHSCWGRKDDRKPKPRAIKKQFDLKVDDVCSYEAFDIKLLKVTSDYIDILVYNNKGVCYDKSQDFERDFNIRIYKGKLVRLDVPFDDAMEWYDISYKENGDI